MICHHYRSIFIHIPKAAGQSIEHTFLNLLGLNWETRAPLLLRSNDCPDLGPPRLAHLKAEEYVRYKYIPQDIFDSYFKFAFVRNPWSRLVSIYRFMGFYKHYDFKSFAMSIVTDGIWQKNYWFIGPQSEFVCDADGRVLVDFIGRTENVQSDFGQVCVRLGLSPITLCHINRSEAIAPRPGLHPRALMEFLAFKIKGRHITNYCTYQDYYDQESMEFVGELYKSDVELFNYRFEYPAACPAHG